MAGSALTGIVGRVSGMLSVGIVGLPPARSSTIRRLGLESCEVVTSTAPERSITMRVVPGEVSATRTRATRRSLMSRVQTRFASIRGRAIQNVEVDPLGIVQAVGLVAEIARDFDGDAGDVGERPVADRGDGMQSSAIALRKQHSG